jgi:hypothetical protein
VRAAASGLLAATLSASAVAQAPADWKNVTSGGPLRAGVYGRIAVRPQAPPPPLIYPQPVIAADQIGMPRSPAVYLYVPPGQVRKWKQHCAKWSACEQPVLFVRVDDSPSRWGQWKHRREQVALQERD